jgi:O-antigen ligase
MLSSLPEQLITRILALGAGFTTIFVLSGNITDPVNVTKLFSLGIAGFAAIFLFIFSELRRTIVDFKLVAIVLLAFITLSLISAFNSSAPFSQSFYGVYGRNNGVLTYFLVALFFLTALTIKVKKNFNSILVALLGAGYVNIVYCFWVIAFGDFLGWSNPYGNILGTLGNPNFIGSFLGIFLSVYVAFLSYKGSSKFYRYSALIVVPITVFEIIKSNAIQGRVVAALGIGIVGFYFIRSRYSKLFVLAYVTLGSILATFSLLGALQIGPLTGLIYKTSVSLRGQYWLSGWNTGKSHPLTGVGMDSLGDWYRRSRDAHALVVPGPDTVVNAAHNVVLDMFAFGGFPLFITYLALVGLVFVAILKLTLRSKEFDPILVGLVTAWIGYQTQSIISINQIGLAVWGWLLGGTILAYEKSTRSNSHVNTPDISAKRKKTNGSQNLHLSMVATFGALVGIIVSIPPLTADSKWRSAMVEQSLSATEASMVSSYFNPPNMGKYLVNIQTLESSQFYDLSHKYALEALSWNSNVFELWKTFYFLKNTTAAEKSLALDNMKKLDPLNPDVTAIP